MNETDAGVFVADREGDDHRHGGWDGLSPGEALRRLHEAMTNLTQALIERAER